MLFWTVDLKSAFHLCVLGGCGRPWKSILRWLSSEDGKTYELLRSRIYGCDGSDCSLGCDKSMLAVCLASHYMRCAATPFGYATSLGPLALLTEAFIRCTSRVLGLDVGQSC